MSDIAEKLQRMHQVAGSLSQTRTQQARHTALSADDETAAQDMTDIKNNAVYQIMTKTSLSGDEQINTIAKYLTVQGEDYATARKHFAEFQAYFNHAQNEGMKLDMKGLEKLIEEVSNALKPEVEKIVNDVVAVQKGVDDSKQLLEVMRTARLEGKSIDQIKTALDLNDRILAEIAKIGEALTQLGETQSRREGDLNEALDAKTRSEHGFWNSIKRTIAGPDKAIAADIEEAKNRLERVKTDIEASQKDLADKQAERNAGLETGPMQILRSIDATEDGFAENIVNTAQNSLKLLTRASTSVQRLMKRMAYSKEQAINIAESISKTEIREAILEGAVQRVAKLSHDQSEVIQTRLAAQDQKLEETEDPVEKAALNAERVGVAELQKTALAYEEDVKRTHANFAMATANSVEARSRASKFYNLLLTQEDMLQQLASRTLPETARALRMGLEADVGLQSSELVSSIGAVTRHAIEIGQAHSKDLAVTENELRASQIKTMQDAIDALTSAQEEVVSAAEATVKHSNERGNLTGNLKNATKDLRQLLEEFDDIRARSADPVAAMPPTPAGGGKAVDGPVRPAAPANDAGAPVPAAKLG